MSCTSNVSISAFVILAHSFVNINEIPVQTIDVVLVVLADSNSQVLVIYNTLVLIQCRCVVIIQYIV